MKMNTMEILPSRFIADNEKTKKKSDERTHIQTHKEMINLASVRFKKKKREKATEIKQTEKALVFNSSFSLQRMTLFFLFVWLMI